MKEKPCKIINKKSTNEPIKYMGPYWEYEKGERVCFLMDGKLTTGVIHERTFKQDGLLIVERAIKVEK